MAAGMGGPEGTSSLALLAFDGGEVQEPGEDRHEPIFRHDWMRGAANKGARVAA